MAGVIGDLDHRYHDGGHTAAEQLRRTLSLGIHQVGPDYGATSITLHRVGTYRRRVRQYSAIPALRLFLGLPEETSRSNGGNHAGAPTVMQY